MGNRNTKFWIWVLWENWALLAEIGSRLFLSSSLVFRPPRDNPDTRTLCVYKSPRNDKHCFCIFFPLHRIFFSFKKSNFYREDTTSETSKGIISMKGVVSTETVVPCRWGNELSNDIERQDYSILFGQWRGHFFLILLVKRETYSLTIGPKIA